MDDSQLEGWKSMLERNVSLFGSRLDLLTEILGSAPFLHCCRPTCRRVYDCQDRTIRRERASADTWI